MLPCSKLNRDAPPGADGTPSTRHWEWREMRFPPGVSIDWQNLEVINSSGLLAAIGNGGHALLLVPVSLIDTKNKQFDDGDDVIITPKKDLTDKNPASIAWIEPHSAANDSPQMPELALSLPGTEQMGLKVKWKLKVDYKRPLGDQPETGKITAQDLVLIPTGDKSHPEQQAFKTENLADGHLKFFENADWQAELRDSGGNETRFFGGPAELTYQLLNSQGVALTAEQKILFSIGGKCPDFDKCKAYIDAQAMAVDSRLVRLSYAVGKHESKDYNGEGSRYNQFWNGDGHRFGNDHHRGDPLWCKGSDETSAGGFGIFQITGDATHNQFFNVPREVMWNWQKNTLAYLGIVIIEGAGKPVPNDPSKNGIQLRFFQFVHDIFSASYQEPPTAYAYDGLSLDAWEMGVITLYNGSAGCPTTVIKLPNGKKKEKQNPWKFDPNAASNNHWKYYPNADKPSGYLHNVIQQH